MSDFKRGDAVVVLGMYKNSDERKDVNGKFCQEHKFGRYRGKLIVEVSGVKLFCDPGKVMDAQEYWDDKNKAKEPSVKPVDDDNSGV